MYTGHTSSPSTSFITFHMHLQKNSLPFGTLLRMSTHLCVKGDPQSQQFPTLRPFYRTCNLFSDYSSVTGFFLIGLSQHQYLISSTTKLSFHSTLAYLLDLMCTCYLSIIFTMFLLLDKHNSLLLLPREIFLPRSCCTSLKSFMTSRAKSPCGNQHHSSSQSLLQLI